MSIQGKVRTLFSDLENTEALFPTTKVKAISDDDGVGLDAILGTAVHAGPSTGLAATAPVNADTLGGRKASDYATQNFVAAEIAKARLEGEDVDLSGFATKDYADDSASEAALTALANAKAYTDGNISTWVGDSTVASQIASAVATKAPDGYGLGTGSQSVNSVYDINVNGWYITKGGTPSNQWLICHAVVTNGGSDVTVVGWNLAGSGCFKITKTNGTWGGWETMLDAISDMGTQNGDFNERHTSGIMWMQLASCTNGPESSGYGQLVVSRCANLTLQVFYKYSDGKVYTRQYVNSAWESWKRIDKGAVTLASIGAAPASHSHSAGDVGALPISGGTMTGLLRFGGSAMQNFDSPSVVATYINNNSSEGLGYANTGSLSVGYASSAGNADTLDGKHASDFIPGATAAWLPKHGMTFAELPYGFFAYSVNPGCALSVGFPSGLSEYGTIFGVRAPEYFLLMYVDVFGNFATYNTNEGYWRTIGSDKLSLSGGTMSGDINMGAHNIYGVNALFGTSGTFGTSLPAAGNAGRIFFKKVSG